MKYYLGNWVWNSNYDGFWEAPSGTVGLLDIRSIPQQSQAVTASGVGFFATTVDLDASYLFLGEGYISSVAVDDSIKDAWQTKTGFRPNGSTLLDLLWSQITEGSDPTGQTAVPPLMPNTKPALELYLSGHSLVKSEAFDILTHPHKEKVKAVYKESYRKLKDLEKQGKTKKDMHRKYLDALGDKFGLANPEDYFIPSDLPKETPVKHETTYDDNFTDTNGTVLSSHTPTGTNPPASWTLIENSIDIQSNKANASTNNLAVSARAESDLSGDDNYAQAIFDGSATGTSYLWIVMCRMSSAALTAYTVRRVGGSSAGAFLYRIEKIVAGVTTALESDVTLSATLPETWKIEANGTTITSYLGGVQQSQLTDASIATGVRGGLRGFRSGETVNFDDFEMGDLGTPPTSSTVTITRMMLMGVS